MEALLFDTAFTKPMEPKWSKMFILSLVFHLGLFSLIFIAPDNIPTRAVKDIVYEVNLVEMPRTKPVKEVAKPTASRKVSQTKRISSPKEKPKKVVVAKRVVEVKKQKEKRPAVTSTKLIEQAISKIEKKVEVEKKDHLNQAISRLEKQGGITQKKLQGTEIEDGITIRLYQVEIANWIKSNWSYPVAMESPGSKKDLESLVVLSVKKDGSILKSWFKKKSSNPIFDQSVTRAIERSDPLPPFPEGYRKSYDEIEINFNLRELEGN